MSLVSRCLRPDPAAAVIREEGGHQSRQGGGQCHTQVGGPGGGGGVQGTMGVLSGARSEVQGCTTAGSAEGPGIRKLGRGKLQRNREAEKKSEEKECCRK